MKNAKPREAMLLIALLIMTAVAGLPVSGTPEISYPEKELAEALSKFQSTYAFFEEGKKSLARGDEKAAIRQFESCVTAMPTHIYAHYYLANILYLQREFDEALRAIENAEKHLDFMMAVDAFAQKQKIKEIEDAKVAIVNYHESTNSCRESRKLEQMYRQIDEEQEKADVKSGRERLRQQKLESHYAYFHGNILFQLKKYDRAYQLYQKAIQHDPQNSDAYNNIIAIFYLAGRFQQADQYLQGAEEAGAEDRINLKLKKLVFEALGKPAEGILEQEYGAERREGIRAARFTANVFEGQANQSPFFSNCYIAFDSKSLDAVLIDPGAVDPRVEDYIRENKLNVRLILNTHGHYDHSRANSYYAKLFGTRIAAPRDDAPLYKEDAENRGGKSGLDFFGQNLQAGTLAIRVYPTPGHTAGSSCFVIGDFLFSGDSLFEDTIGKINARDDAEYQEKRKKLASELRKIVDSLPPETQVLPGHGKSTTLLRVGENNPFLSAGQL